MDHEFKDLATNNDNQLISNNIGEIGHLLHKIFEDEEQIKDDLARAISLLSLLQNIFDNKKLYFKRLGSQKFLLTSPDNVARMAKGIKPTNHGGKVMSEEVNIH